MTTDNQDLDALDRLVAERVMGWRRGTTPDGHGGVDETWEHPSGGLVVICELWQPSRDIAQAWQVVGRLKQLEFEVQVVEWPDGEAACFLVDLTGQERHVRFYSDTSPEAICRAAVEALAAVGGEHA